MFTKKSFVLISLLIGVTLTLTILANTAPAQARAPLQSEDGSKCITCHENLYYLHDTGKSYCLKDAPMACVDCHGGDPTALTQEAAHFKRAAHPVINANDKKCYDCHPVEADTRLDKFRQVAGIKKVLVVAPYQPVVSQVADFPAEKLDEWVLGFETIPLFLVAGLALTIFIVFKIRHG
jgi:hypothetical protein